MNRRPVTPAVRKRRIFTDALLLLAGVALLLLMLDVPLPYLTERQALSAAQARYLYGPGAVLARAEDGDRAVNYLLQDGPHYAVCTLPREGPFWGFGYLDAVEDDPSLPLAPLLPSAYLGHNRLAVFSNDPAIAEVEVLCYDYAYRGKFLTLRQPPLAESCWLFAPPPEALGWDFSDGFLLRGYDGDGNLIYQSDAPGHWVEQWGLTIPE